MELFNIEAEQYVLGAMGIDPTFAMTIISQITLNDFFEPKHKEIYKCIRSSLRDDYTVSSIEIVETLKKCNLDHAKYYIDQLFDQFIPIIEYVEEHIAVLKKYSQLRMLDKIGPEIQNMINENLEPTEIADAITNKLMEDTKHGLEHFRGVKEVLNDVYEELSNKHNNTNLTYIPTGFPQLDHILLGFNPGDLVILAARPSLGKTALALNIAKNMAMSGKSVGFISLEMTAVQLGLRLLSAQANIDMQKMLEAKLQDSDWQNIGPAIDKIGNCKFYINDYYNSSINDLRMKLLKLKIEHNLDVLFVDYLQLLSGSYKNNRVQEIAEISRMLKMLARQLHIPIVALSQLSRDVEHRSDKRPILSDLRDSGSIEQDADIVMMMYREDYYEPDTSRKNITDIYIRKHRNGPIGEAHLLFDKFHSKFNNI